MGIVAPEDTSSTKSELPPVIIPAVVPPVSAASTDAHHALSSSDEMTLTIAGPTAATQPVRTVQIVTCSDSSVASTITTSTVYCLDKLRSASATGTKLHMEPISPSLALASDLRKGSTTATKMAIATSTDEEISDEDSNGKFNICTDFLCILPTLSSKVYVTNTKKTLTFVVSLTRKGE